MRELGSHYSKTLSSWMRSKMNHKTESLVLSTWEGKKTSETGNKPQGSANNGTCLGGRRCKLVLTLDCWITSSVILCKLLHPSNAQLSYL